MNDVEELEEKIAGLKVEIEELKKRLAEQELVTKRLSQIEALNYYIGKSGLGTAFFIDGPVVLRTRSDIDKKMLLCPHCKEDLVNGQCGYIVHLKPSGHFAVNESLAAFHEKCYKEIMKKFGLD